jgi:general secretion pathway protein G
MTRQTRKGFTLIEILIVVIILGILAAIVIPQFTNASKDAKKSSLVTMVQSLRSQVALFKLQHNDNLPGNNAGAFSSAVFWNQMTMFSDLAGNTNATKTVVFDKGPYMQSIATNPLNTRQNVEDGTGNVTNVAGFVFDFNAGNGSGKVWGTDVDSLTIIPQ